jgi:protein O-GlcNAc transferase
MPHTIDEYIAEGSDHQQHGRLQQAEAAYRAALALDPNHAEALRHLGMLAHLVGHNDAAADLIRQAIRVTGPRTPAHHHGALGWILHQLGHAVEAERALRKSLKLQPDSSNWHNCLGHVMYAQGRIATAAECWKKAVALDPAAGGALSNYANVLQETGAIEQAMAAHRRAADLAGQGGQADTAWDNYLRDIGFLPDIDPAFVKAAHADWAATFLKSIDDRLVRRGHPTGRDPDRTLKIGLLSADFRRHSVAYFIEPLLRHADRNNLSLYCYANVASPDAVTARLRQYQVTWRNIVGRTDPQVADVIGQDGIDILVDLGGHTSGNRCRVLAYRAAPIQMTYLGYPFGTGLAACDYRLTDGVSDPPGDHDGHYTERLLRLPLSSWCFDPSGFDVPVAPAPAVRTGHVTFGSFNTLNKTNDRVLDTWAQILQRMPDARVLLKCHGLDDPSVREALITRFTARRVEASRVTLRGLEHAPEAHLAVYQQVDIALDTFPYNGTTTTCEALWQGVPVVTLQGETHVARVGATLLQAIGLGELVGRDTIDYVDRAVDLASDRARCTELRTTLRERLRASPLCDQLRFARGFASAMRQAWQEYCR